MKPTHEVEGWCEDPACNHCCYHLETEQGLCVSCGKQLESIEYDDGGDE